MRPSRHLESSPAPWELFETAHSSPESTELPESVSHGQAARSDSEHSGVNSGHPRSLPTRTASLCILQMEEQVRGGWGR